MVLTGAVLALALGLDVGSQSPAAPREAAAVVRGRVDVTQGSPVQRRPTAIEPGGPVERGGRGRRQAVVYFETAPRGAFEDRESTRVSLDQRNETFVPHVLAITAGTTVDFPNHDRTYHNVFSLSKAKRFDLGRYAAGTSKAVRFDRPGIVRVFCDIHSHMSAFILVFGHRFFAVTDDEGRYAIEGVPPGTYTLSAWYEGTVREQRAVTVEGDTRAVELDFVLR